MNKISAVNWIAAARQSAPQAFAPQPSPAFAKPVVSKPGPIARALV